jgi:hypothetical protein
MRDLAELHIKQFGRVKPRPKPSDEEISWIEKMTSTKLPDSYLQFIDYSNGGSPQLDTFICEGHEWIIDNFFPLTSAHDKIEHFISVEWSYKHRWPGAKKEILPIGSDPLGNLICLDLSSPGLEKVILWVHDTAGKQIRLVANSFEEFIDSLSPSRIDNK